MARTKAQKAKMVRNGDNKRKRLRKAARSQRRTQEIKT